MSEEQVPAEKWIKEAEGVVNDIEQHVSKIEIVEGTDQLIFFNVTTIEEKDYCVELSLRGFRVVGNSYNQKNLCPEDYYETPYSLLGAISPQFYLSFGSELVKKLNKFK